MVSIIFAAVSHIAMSTLAPVTAWMALYPAGLGNKAMYQSGFETPISKVG